MVSKVCKICEKDKPLDEYYFGKQTGYYYGWCKACHYVKTKKIRKKWVKDFPDKAKKVTRKAMRRFVERGTPGVYLMETDKGCFVGHSNSIQTRMFQHTSPQQPGPIRDNKAKLISYTIIEEVEDKVERQKRKEYYVDLLQPSLNKKR